MPVLQFTAAHSWTVGGVRLTPDTYTRVSDQQWAEIQKYQEAKQYQQSGQLKVVGDQDTQGKAVTDATTSSSQQGSNDPNRVPFQTTPPPGGQQTSTQPLNQDGTQTQDQQQDTHTSTKRKH